MPPFQGDSGSDGDFTVSIFRAVLKGALNRCCIPISKINNLVKEPCWNLALNHYSEKVNEIVFKFACVVVITRKKKFYGCYHKKNAFGGWLDLKVPSCPPIYIFCWDTSQMS